MNNVIRLWITWTSLDPMSGDTLSALDMCNDWMHALCYGYAFSYFGAASLSRSCAQRASARQISTESLDTHMTVSL
jgi:hypothetical protein